MTCDETTVSHANFRPSKKQRRNYNNNVIDVLFRPTSRAILLDLLTRSCNNIASVFLAGTDAPEVDRIREIVAGSASHYELLYLFFILLNVDEIAKDHILSLENPHNHHKLTRFFVDLRACTARMFSHESTSQFVTFVDQCHEIYILA